MIAVGSTLQVYPAAGFPQEAKMNGAHLVIITLSTTPLNDMADVVIDMKISDFLDRLGEY
jgi:NAD-dependent deacetylase